jgi:hypothetical protein
LSDLRPHPTGRIELEHLKDWLEKMKEIYLPDLEVIIQKNLPPKLETVKKVEEIFIHAFKELAKQVSVQSRLRGEMIESTFETLRYVWARYPEQQIFEFQKKQEASLEKFSKNREKYKEKIVRLENFLEIFKNELEKTRVDKQELTDTLSYQESLISNHEDCIKELMEFKSRRFHAKDAACQTLIDLKGDLERSFLKGRSMKIFSPFEQKREEMQGIQIVLNGETNEFDDKTPFVIKKENFVNEIRKITQDFDLPDDLDLGNIQESIFNSSENVEDWLSGFKLGINISLKNKNERIPTLSTQATLPSPLLPKEEKSSRLKPRRSQQSKPLTSIDTEVHGSNNLIKTLLLKPETRLQKYAKNTKKKIKKHINQVIYFATGKKFSQNFTLGDLSLQQLMNKYNLKNIARRKLKELVVGCMFNCKDCPRMRLFLSAIGAGGFHKFPDTSLEGVEIMIKLYDFMINNKTGFVLEASDPLDIPLFPLSRAFECVRQVLGHYLCSEKMMDLVNSLKKLMETDPFHINKEGVINVDVFVEVALTAFEEYLKNINDGVRLVTESITEYNYLNKREVGILFKHLAHKKMSFIKLLNFDESGLVNVEDFRAFCIEHSLFRLDSVQHFFENCEDEEKNIIEKLNQFEGELDGFFDLVNEETLKLKEWRWKFQFLILNLKSRKTSKHLNMFQLLQAEYIYIRNHIKHLNNGSC